MIDKGLNHSIFLIITLVLLGIVPLNLQAGGVDDTTTIQQQDQPELDSYEASLTAAQLRQYQALMSAIHDDDIEAARTALAGGYILPNRGTVSITSPLIRAGSIGKPEFVSLLLEAGANPQVMVKVLKSVRGSIEHLAFSLYTSIKAQQNYAEKGEEYPLDAARDEKITECLRLFLEAGADPNIVSKRGTDPVVIESAMGWMAVIGNTEAMVLLHQYGGDVNLPAYGHIYNPFDAASRKDHYETVEWLLDHELDVHQEDERGHTPLESLASRDINIAKMFLERGLVDPIKQDYFQIAMAEDDFEFANQLLDMGADVNRSYNRFENIWEEGQRLHIAISDHSFKWLEFLFSKDVDPCLKFRGRTAYEEMRRQIEFKPLDIRITHEREQVLALLQQYKPESECQDN